MSGTSPAFLSVQQTAVGADLSLQLHLGVEQLAVTLPLGGQTTPHLLQLTLQAANHLGKVLQLAGVELLRALQRVLQAFLLRGRRHLSVSGTVTPQQQQQQPLSAAEFESTELSGNGIVSILSNFAESHAQFSK